MARAPTGSLSDMTERIPLLQLGSLQSRLPELIARKGAPPWSEAVVLTDDIQAFIICHAPGHPNDTHYHLHDEWWVVLQGEIDWHIEGTPTPFMRRRATSSRPKPLASSRPVAPRQHPRASRAGRVPIATTARLQPLWASHYA